MENDNAFQLTAEVFTDIPMYSEVVPVTAVEAAEPAEEEQAPDEYVFVLPEPLLPAGELTPFEQQVLSIVVTADYDPFQAAFINEDGSRNELLFAEVTKTWLALGEAGVDPADYAVVAEQWLLA